MLFQSWPFYGCGPACGLSFVLRPADISIWCVAAVLRCLPWSVQALHWTGRIPGGQLAKDAGNNWLLIGHCNKCPASLNLSANSSLTKPTNQALYNTYKIAMQMLAVPAFTTGAQTASGNLLTNDSTHRMVHFVSSSIPTRILNVSSNRKQSVSNVSSKCCRSAVACWHHKNIERLKSNSHVLQAACLTMHMTAVSDHCDF